MAQKNVLIKPIITEKSELLSDKINHYVFLVDKKANKIEIKKAVESMYGVAVDSVNTMILPGKTKSRYTKAGLQRGRKPAYKKAVIRLFEGEEIDFYSDL